MVTRNVMVTFAPTTTVPRSTLTDVSPAILPTRMAPCELVTEPTTSAVFAPGVSLNASPVKSIFPVLVIVTVYSRVSPGDGMRSPSASMARASILVASTLGSSTGVTVGSSAVPVSGSSVGTEIPPSPVTRPWLATLEIAVGKGEFTVTSKVMVTVSETARVPMFTLTVVSPAVLPVVTVPCDVVTEPTTKVVLASGVSVKSTEVAPVVPVFETIIV